MPTNELTESEIVQFNQDGYLIVKSLFDGEEMEILRRVAGSDQSLEKRASGHSDGEGGVSKLSFWHKMGEDLYGQLARCHRVVDRMEQLLGGEVCFYHSKMVMKEPFTGGAWAWHQDYGYWYDAFLFPDLASCFIAVNHNTRENGCMQVLKGSHRMGRLNHVKLPGEGGALGQTGADPERLAEASKRLELVYCLLEPGDALFFHSNTLHRSDQNKSPHPRWSMICCYNAANNSSYKDHFGREPGHPRYEPLIKVSDSAIKKAGKELFASSPES